MASCHLKMMETIYQSCTWGSRLCYSLFLSPPQMRKLWLPGLLAAPASLICSYLPGPRCHPVAPEGRCASPSSSTTCRRTEVGIVSGSSSDFPSPSSDFHDSSCSAKAIASGNSRGRECNTSTAPGGGDTPRRAQKGNV